MSFTFSHGSIDRMNGVHPDLIRVAMRALELSAIDFKITEGVRTPSKQAKLFAAGASRTLNSKHLVQSDGYSHAIDVAALVDGDVRWDWPLYHEINKAFRKASIELGIGIEWGGDWVNFPDGPHYQLASKPMQA